MTHVSEAVERVREDLADARSEERDIARVYVNDLRAILAEIARLTEQVRVAREIARDYGSIDGSHHKMWVIDQMVRALTGDDYAAWVAEHNDGEDGPDTYEWDEGIAP